MFTVLASYLNKPVYGINCKSTSNDVKLKLDSFEDDCIFYIEYNYNNLDFCPFFINKLGFFIYFDVQDFDCIDENLIFIQQLLKKSLFKISTVEELEQLILDNKINLITTKITLLCCDKYGNSIFIKTTNSQLEFIKNSNNHIFIDDCLNHDEKENIDNYILENKSSFNLTYCLETLRKCFDSSNKNLYTFIIEPQKNETYFILNQDVEHIYRVCLNFGNIETFHGFYIYQRTAFEDGILTNELLQNLKKYFLV